MDEKQKRRRPFQLSLTLALLLVALFASLLAVWRVRHTVNDGRPIDFDSRVRNLANVTISMTRNEVAEIMGEQDSGDVDRWSYRIAADDKRGGWITISLIFEDGRVKEVARGHESYVQTINVYVPSP